MEDKDLKQIITKVFIAIGKNYEPTDTEIVNLLQTVQRKTPLVG